MTIQAPPRPRPGWSTDRSLQRMAREVDVERLSIDTIRRLALDAEEAVGSGHPITPMVLAPVVHVLVTRYLKHDPGDSGWADRDRIVLSADHASALVSAALQLTGYDVPLDELRLGPLSQGVANAVEMALTERLLAEHFNHPRHEIINHHTWVFASDGDLMESVTGEAASLAGCLGLGKLVVFYDNNRLTIEGSTDLAFAESVKRRFEAYGWQVLSVGDVNDVESLARAIEAARADVTRPSLVVVRFPIANGSTAKQRTAGAHGTPLGPGEADGVKEQLGWPHSQPSVPGVVRTAMAGVRSRGERRHEEWEIQLLRYQQDRPDLAAELERVLAGELPASDLDPAVKKQLNRCQEVS